MPKQKNDTYSPGTPAINYTSAGQKWRIDEKADVGSDNTTILSTFDNNKLINKGYIYSLGGPATLFTGNNAKITNKDTGLISGDIGILISSGTATKATVENQGKILGGSYGILSSGPGDFMLDNEGDIYGYAYGVLAIGANAGSNSGPQIDNTGHIESDLFGVFVGAATPGWKSKVTNEEDGVIKGGTIAAGGSAVFNAVGEMVLKNEGKIKGDVYSANEADKVVNKGKIKGDVYLGDGDDTFKDKGDGKVKGKIAGQDGNDKIVLNDTSEKILFDTALNAATNVDRVKNFESGDDTFCLDNAIFASLSPGELPGSQFIKGTAAADADDYIIYNKSSGALYYDADGNGGGAQVQFAQLDPDTKLKASDFDVIV